MQNTRLRNWIIGVLIGYALLLVGSAAYQAAASGQEARQYPAPGRLIEMGGYEMHLQCTGDRDEGAPLVVLEGGIGAPGFMWVYVQEGISERARVCSYDRAGYGWSTENRNDERTADRLADELHEVLGSGGEAPPYLLVGHSFGSVIGRIYTDRYPDEVAGLIWVDPRHEDFFERMPPEYLQIDQRNLRNARLLRVITPMGITRVLGRLAMLDAFESYLAPLPDDLEAAGWARIIYNPAHWETSLAEREASEASYAMVRQTNLPDDLPLVVITARQGVDAWRPAGYAPDENARQIWMDMQREQSELTDQGEWVVIEDSGHYVYFDAPEAITDAVIEMMGKQ
jgi:pimeloyl-ACP methyl ester carboxylesterase